MRITTGLQFLSSLDQIRDQNAALYDSRLEVSTGRRLRSGAQAPQDYARALQLRQAEDDSDRFTTTSQQVRSDLGSYDSALGELGNVVLRARQLAVQGASDALTPDQRSLISQQVGTLLEEALAIGNKFQDGKYMFAGSSSGTAPYAPLVTAGQITGVAYSGDDRTQSAELEAGVRMETSVSGIDVFGEPPDSPDNLFGALIKLRDDIAAGSAGAVSASIATIDTATDRFLGLRGELGVRVQHLDNLAKFRENALQIVRRERSEIEDADLPKAITRLTQQEAGFQAALTVASRLQRDSLIDRLR